MKHSDICGQTFGRLTAVRRVGTYKSGGALWLFACVCGGETITLASHARTGHTRSCGCLWSETHTIHGLSHSAEYQAWAGMLARCNDPSARGWDRYGGRGIRVCERWASFENFLADMGAGPSADLSIDRVNNNGNYEPSNCRWATTEQQSSNRRDNVHLTFQGRTQTLSQWARELQISPAGLHRRLKRHSVEVALGAGKARQNTPVAARAAKPAALWFGPVRPMPRHAV